MKITCIEHPTEQDWMACKERALVTVGLKAVNPPTEEWRKSILKARHSPIRRLRFSFLLEDIPSWVSVHLVRHIHAQPYVKSQRNDRQSKYDRRKAPQDAPVIMDWWISAEEIITVSHKRLCMQASEETREIIRILMAKIEEACPEFQGLLRPLCEYRNGMCSEFHPCGRAKVIE